jgi:peptidyl-prolyl cis-trans isomerase SDCCAG10
VLIQTTYGDLEVELWCKECPRAARNFIQLALEGYYEDTLFHRVVPGFLVQAGDPTGTGHGGESIYKDDPSTTGKMVEAHSRLTFNRRGLLGMASTADSTDLGSQFFFTLDRAEELDRKHTLFGRIVGDTVFNLLRIGEVELEEGSADRPLYPPKIINVSVLVNPFEDIIPRESIRAAKKVEAKKAPVSKPAAAPFKAKNKALLSFQDEEEEEDSGFSGMISSHDILNDPTLSKQAMEPIAAEPIPVTNQKGKAEAVSKEPSAYEKIKLEREANLRKIGDSIAAVQQQIKGVDSQESTAAAIVEAAPKKPRIDSVSALLGRTGKTKAPSKLSLLQQQQEAYRRKPNVIVGKRGVNQVQEVNTLLTLNAFREKLQSASDPSALDKATAPEPAKVLEICKLHGLVNCLSCKDTFGVQDDNAIGEEGWLMHRLVFDKDSGYKEIREELTNLVVIDPRERAKEIKKQK